MDVSEYGATATKRIWSDTHTTHLRHDLWLRIAEAQKTAGLPIPDLSPYHATATRYTSDHTYATNYDKDHHNELANTKHETVAALRTYEAHSGNHGALHLGLTSSDISENTQQTQILESAKHTITYGEALIRQLSGYLGRTAPMVGRTHNVPAQTIRFADRIDRAMCEISHGTRTLHAATQTYPCRGLAGAVGNNNDLLQLLGGDRYALAAINQAIFNDIIRSTGQCYPRSWDLPILSGVIATVSGAASLATTVRLMIGQGLASTSRTRHQVGSSAMAHKSNPIEAERIQGLHKLMLGYHTSLVATTGCTWNEGDITDSSTRRVALPGFFHTATGILLNASHMLHAFQLDTTAIRDEHTHHLALLHTGTLLADAILAGANRNDAHAAILDAYGSSANPRHIATMLGTDNRIPLDAEQIHATITDSK